MSSHLSFFVKERTKFDKIFIFPTTIVRYVPKKRVRNNGMYFLKVKSDI